MRPVPFSRNNLCAVVLLVVAAFGPAAVCAQSAEPVEVLRIDADLVNLNVSVFNRTAANTAASLQQKDFSILDNGVLQEITFFATNDAPFDLVLLLDLSG